MKKELSKETVTTLESVLKGKELKSFKEAQKTWRTMPKDAQAMLQKMNIIGTALNNLYDKGNAKGLKKESITVIVRKAFEGLQRRERSEYRKLAVNYTGIRLFVEFANVKSANPTYLVNAWLKAVKEDCEACREVELYLAGGYDAQGNLMSQEGVGVDTGNKSQTGVTNPPLKSGLSVVGNPLTADEVTQQAGFICNQIKTLYNEGKFTIDHLATIETHLTSCIQHINAVDIAQEESQTG